MKHIIVTGGSGGIGRSIIEELSRENYEIVNLDIVKPEKLFCLGKSYSKLIFRSKA